MAVQWTEEQLAAIQARGSNILVAAAAGSGKTAVLVERIIQRICDDENPVSIDRLLVLTFTEAAAAEMKRKIAQAIYERLQKEPENPWLREQNLLVHSAHISTIHSFCKTMIQNNIHETQIPTDFTLIDPAENEMLLNQALDQVLERYYRRIAKKHAFRELAVGYGGIKSDDNLRSTVLALLGFVKSMAYPKRWLHQAAEQYQELCKTGTINGSVWEQRVSEQCRALACEILEGYRVLAKIVRDGVPKDLPIYTYFTELPDKFAMAYAPVLSGAKALEEIRSAQASFDKGRAVGMNKLDEQVAARIDFVRKKLINPPMDEIKQLLECSAPEKVKQMILSAPRVKVLVQLVRQTERLHQTMKQERSALDFNDLEHELLRLLADKHGNPTPVAKKLQTRFAEILVDEYQDTNDIQDTIFRMLSRDDSNIFMVGDLKQCIYQFRNANPAIFADKYRRYLKGDGGQCIRLFKNFRSRREVVDCVNGVFSSLMSERLGGISYTEDEYLMQGASYPEAKENLAGELLVTDVNVENYSQEGSYTNMTAYEMEAVTIAGRIKNLLENRELLVTDKETGELRPLRPGDITILMQTSTHMGEVSKILEEYGIPVADTVGRKYLDSLEVLTVLNFLQVIDNPLQDIPLLAVLRSGMFDFSPDELARIRLCREGNFYTALCAAADEGDSHAAEFIDVLHELRNDAAYMGVDELIWKICHELHFVELAGAMPGGKLRQENLNLLYEHAVAFEQGVLHGLFHFVEYIETLRAGNADFVAAKSLVGEEDMVCMSTIHKSKGLEYPVVILCGLQQYFMESDAAKSIIWDEKFGIAMDWVDTIHRVRYSGLPKKLAREHIIQEQRSEEMRLLYVAMTRAKEKLIFSCTVGKMRNQWKEAVYDVNGHPVEACARRSTSMKDWLLSALMPHPEARTLREIAKRTDVLPDHSMQFPLQMAWVNHENTPLLIPETIAESKEISQVEPAELSKSVKERLCYQYPHRGLGQTPIKLSVSELKRRQMPEEGYAPQLLKMPHNILTDVIEIGAAERGVIHHYVLQHIDERNTDSPLQIEEQLETMVKEKLISARQREAVSAAQLFEFFCHPLGQRLKAADKIFREFDFYMQIPAEEVTDSLPDEDRAEPVLLQGIADCFFYEGDRIVLIDYKTDRISKGQAEKRAERYRAQIEYYERGLNEVLPYPIAEKYLYFLNCSTAVAIK